MTQLRLASSDDREAVIRLIDTVLREYGDQICLDGAEADLLDIERNYFDQGGIFWVLCDPGLNDDANRDRTTDFDVIGCHAAIADPQNSDVCIFKRLYLAKPYRGGAWGKQLMQVAVDWARQSGFRRIEFWSDCRFERAHRFFAKFGFRTTYQVRTMGDSHQPYEEFFFWLDLVD